MKTRKPVSTYFDADGNFIKVFAEKKAKHAAWMCGAGRGAAMARIPDDCGRIFVTFSRHAGKI